MSMQTHSKSPWEWKVEDGFIIVSPQNTERHNVESSFFMWNEEGEDTQDRPPGSHGAILGLQESSKWTHIEEYDANTGQYFRRSMKDIANGIDSVIQSGGTSYMGWNNELDEEIVRRLEREAFYRKVNNQLEAMEGDLRRKNILAERDGRMKVIQEEVQAELGDFREVAARMFRENHPELKE